MAGPEGDIEFVAVGTSLNEPLPPSTKSGCKPLLISLIGVAFIMWSVPMFYLLAHEGGHCLEFERAGFDAALVLGIQEGPASYETKNNIFVNIDYFYRSSTARTSERRFSQIHTQTHAPY